MPWKLKIYFDDGTEEEVDEVFETEEDAEEEYRSWLENWGEGREVLMLANEDYIESDITDCDIWEEE